MVVLNFGYDYKAGTGTCSGNSAIISSTCSAFCSDKYFMVNMTFTSVISGSSNNFSIFTKKIDVNYPYIISPCISSTVLISHSSSTVLISQSFPSLILSHF